jgi:hypothetical protein
LIGHHVFESDVEICQDLNSKPRLDKFGLKTVSNREHSQRIVLPAAGSPPD